MPSQVLVTTPTRTSFSDSSGESVRFRAGIVTAPGRRPSFEFIRACQGHSIPFIIKERVGAPRPDAEVLKTNVALWHGTLKA